MIQYVISAVKKNMLFCNAPLILGSLKNQSDSPVPAVLPGTQYVYRCAVYCVPTEYPDPEKTKWWYWKDENAKPRP